MADTNSGNRQRRNAPADATHDHDEAADDGTVTGVESAARRSTEGPVERATTVYAGRHPLLVELRDHLPFSVSAVAIGLILAGIMCVFINVAETGTTKGESVPPAKLLFHLFHPPHMLFSAAATAAMFARYERKYAKAAVVGLLGAVVICGVSDIVMPHLSLWILGYSSPLHLCVVHHPWLVVPFAVIGVAVGLLASLGVSRSTLFSHSLHVFASTMASIFYLVGTMGLIAWIDRIGVIVLFVLVAVVVPCCLSDIVFPLALSKKGRTLYAGVSHSH